MRRNPTVASFREREEGGEAVKKGRDLREL
jgi:hypothetical protein